MKILIINGPNLNLLGLREPDIYGKRTYGDLEGMIRAEAERLGVTERILGLRVAKYGLREKGGRKDVNG